VFAQIFGLKFQLHTTTGFQQILSVFPVNQKHTATSHQTFTYFANNQHYHIIILFRVCYW